MRQITMPAAVQKIEAVDLHVFILRQRDARSPFFPAIAALATIKLGADKADDDDFLFLHLDKYLSFQIIYHEFIDFPNFRRF